MKYNHVLALYPYFKDTTATMGVFPPPGLEYIATNMKDLVGKVTLLDLRYENEYQNIEILFKLLKGGLRKVDSHILSRLFLKSQTPVRTTV